MLENLLFQKLWIILPTCLLLYMSDYLLTILGARYYKAGAREHIMFEGSYELTPEFQRDIDSLRLFSGRFLIISVMLGALITLLWYCSHQGGVAMLEFKFLWGGFVLLELAIHFRHARNIALFSFAKNHEGISGQVVYKRWLSYRISFVELTAFAVLFLIGFLITGALPLLGGSVLAEGVAVRHAWLSRRKAPP